MKSVVTPRLAVQPFAATPDELIRLANLIASNCGLSMSTQRVTRLVRRFKSTIEHRGFDFFDYYCTQIQLDIDERHRLLADPAIAKAISYCDPTGERAVDNVMKERGKRGECPT